MDQVAATVDGRCRSECIRRLQNGLVRLKRLQIRLVFVRGKSQPGGPSLGDGNAEVERDTVEVIDPPRFASLTGTSTGRTRGGILAAIPHAVIHRMFITKRQPGREPITNLWLNLMLKLVLV
jgi:hypothetical protein